MFIVAECLAVVVDVVVVVAECVAIVVAVVVAVAAAAHTGETAAAAAV
jgi:hypothetical protein